MFNKKPKQTKQTKETKDELKELIKREVHGIFNREPVSGFCEPKLNAFVEAIKKVR